MSLDDDGVGGGLRGPDGDNKKRTTCTEANLQACDSTPLKIL